MGKSSAKRSRSSGSDASADSMPEPRSAELTEKSTADAKSEDSSQEDEDGQGDAQWAGEQVLSLLKGVDQKKLIALLQQGALNEVLSNDVQREKRLSKVVQENILPFLLRDAVDTWDNASRLVQCQMDRAPGIG